MFSFVFRSIFSWIRRLFKNPKKHVFWAFGSILGQKKISNFWEIFSLGRPTWANFDLFSCVLFHLFSFFLSICDFRFWDFLEILSKIPEIICLGFKHVFSEEIEPKKCMRQKLEQFRFVWKKKNRKKISGNSVRFGFPNIDCPTTHTHGGQYWRTQNRQNFLIFVSVFFFLTDSNFYIIHSFGSISSLKTCLKSKSTISEILKNSKTKIKIENHILKKKKEKKRQKKKRKKIEIRPC